ncbi:MAG: choice-of-anchor D domain-containing protein, partial [Deltaproteobacteria bacterium]|nr:choice-of-anchor D domain-containing protein [Deltaproteobacteria bacterium]
MNVERTMRETMPWKRLLKSSNHWNFLVTLIFTCFLLFLGQIQAATLGGSEVEGSLKIECNNSGMRVYAYLDGTWKQQTFSDNKSSMVHYEQGGTFKYTAGYYQGTAMTCTKNENISSTVNERIWTGGSVKLTMRTTYVSPSKTESYVFVVENTSGSALSNVKLFHGQDTYLGYSDAGGGFWNSSQGVVGVQKPSQDNPDRLIYQTLGSASTKPNDYASANYGTVAGLVAQGALNQTIDANYSTDNGYAVQWNLGSLSPGQSVTINAGETMAVGASLGATLTGGEIGTSMIVTGVLENAGDTTSSGTLAASVDLAGWTAVINGSTSFNLSQGQSMNVPITVTCPAVVSVGQVASVTLSATSSEETASAAGSFRAVYYDGVALVTNVTDDGAASIAELTDFGGRLVGSVVTQQFTVYNGGPSNITLLTNALTGSSQFQVAGIPETLAVGESTNFTVTFDVASYATETATLTLYDHKAWSPFVMNLRGYGYVINPDNGPKVGGNTVTITNGALGGGADITQVTVDGRNADILDQGANWVTFVVPAQSSTGLKDIAISSVSIGTKTMRACYQVNPTPYISSVSPKSAEGAGVSVTIKGRYLGNGNLADLTNVTICGIAATDWALNGTTQLVVKTGAGGEGKGNVIVDSISHGRAISYNSFAYGGAKFGVVWTNTGASALSGGTPETKYGNDFGYVASGRVGERLFAITNAGIMPVQISMVATTGPGAAYFKVVECPAQVAANAKGTLRVAFSSDVPVNAEATLLFYHSSSNSPFRLNLLAEAITVSPMEGPYAGGTTITLSNMTFGSLGTVAGISFRGISGAITAMGTNWMRITTPNVGVTTGWQDGAVRDAIQHRSLLNSFYFNSPPTLSSATPNSGSYTGGYQVIIRGLNLCSDADDLDYVKLAGVNVASIVSAMPTQVIVIAGAGFGAGRISEIQSKKYGYAYKWDMFRYIGASNVYAFSTNAGTASGGNPVTLSYADFGGGVNVTSAYVNGQAVAVTAQGSNSVTFLMPPAEWAFMSVTNVRLYTEGHGEVTYSCGYWTNLGYVYRDKAFIGRPDIQSNVWQGIWKNLGFSMTTSREDIYAMAFGPDGRLYVAGELDMDGFYSDSQVAYFENGRWNETGIKATYVTSMTRQGDHLYVGGLNLTNYYGQVGKRAPILRGSRQDWTPLTYTSVTANTEPWCRALHHDGTNLYAADYHYSYPGAPDVFRYNGSSWTALADNSYTATVYALGTYMGRLYRSGERPWQVNHYANPVQYWSGSDWPDAGWVDTNDYADSYSARALSFCEFKGKYYAGQAFCDPYTADSGKMQLLYRDGTSYYPGWQNVPGFVGMRNMMNKDNTGTRALCTDGQYLFAAGVQMWYTPAPPGSNYSCVAAFDGTSWSAIGTQGLTTNYGEYGLNAWHINSLFKTPRGIYAGGLFPRIGVNTNFMTGATNVAFFEFALTNGLAPQTGPAAGGTQVTIHGFNLGNGSADDVYRVTICGVDVASINSVSSTQIVVTTAVGAGTGDAMVYTYDYGIITASNVFTYTGGAGLALYDLTGSLFSNASPAATEAGTRSMLAAGQRLTNTFTLVNPGDVTLNITGVQTNGSGASAFECIWPSSLAAGQTGTVQVVFSPAVSGTFTAAVQVANNSTANNPFVLNLECVAAGLSTNNGPYAGGNTLVLTNLAVGTVTNVLVGSAGVSPASSGTNWLSLIMPSATNAGTVDIVLQTSDGSYTLPSAYTYNPAGWINRVVDDGFSIGGPERIDSTTQHAPINVYYKSRHFQFVYTADQLAAAGIEGPATISALGFNVYQSPASALPNFLFRLKHTTATNMSAGFDSSGLSVCYSNASYAPIAGDFDMLDLTTTFEWDGQQNIILDSAFSPVGTSSQSGRAYYFYAPDYAYQGRFLYGTTDQSYLFTGGTASYNLYQLGVRASFGTQGVTPSIGITTGGYEVVISGRDLCADDVTSVTLCGVEAAEIVSMSATQVVVRAGAAPGEMSGAVTIYSTSHGISTLADAFRYAGAYSVLGTDGSLIASGSEPREENGTLFDNAGGGAAITNVFAITNNIGSAVTISSMSFTGAQANVFSVSPTSLTLDVHAVSNFAVVFQPQSGGNPSATLVLESDLGHASMNVAGTAWALSATVGAEEGGQVVTITNGAQMGFGDITEVIVGGMSVVPIAQGENWVRIAMPGHAAGLVDIVVISTILGETTLPNAYTYAPAPVIYGSDFAWEELPGLPQALYQHAAFVLNDQLYVAGGLDTAYESVTNVYRFDGYRWHDAPSLPEARSAGAGIVLNGLAYYIGGSFTNTAVTNVYSFNGTNWTQVAGLPGAVTKGVAGVVDGNIVVAGGQDASDTYRTNAYLFDGTSWTPTAGLPAARSEQGGAVRNGKLYAFGGRNDGSAATFNQYSFNGSSWVNEPGLPSVLFGAGAATLNNRVYAFGGSDGAAVKDSAYRYDGIGWSSASVMPTNLYASAATFWRGAAYVAGGMDTILPLHSNLWRMTDGGVSPISGYPAGGYEVTLRGTNLCGEASNDVEWVTLCGTTAEVVSVSSTQIVVVAGASSSGFQTGNVEIRSATYGLVIASNGFTYLRGAITLIGTNGADIAPGSAASAANGTDFGSMMVSQSRTNIFGIRNTGNAPLTLTAIDGAGQGGPSFTVTAFPTNELAIGATGQITVVCASQGGDQLGELIFRDNVAIDPYAPDFLGNTVSVYNVKSYGSGSGLGLSTTSLTFSASYGGSVPAAQTFTVSNTGGDTLAFSNTIAYASFGENWLTVAPETGSLNASASQTITNAVSLTGLNAGTHTATVSVWCATATNSPQLVRVSLVVAPIAQTITWTNPGTQTYTNETLLDATVNSGLAPTYTLISGPGVLTNMAYKTYLNYTSTGTVVVAASQVGNLNYNAAPPVTQSWDVIRAPGQITLTNLTQGYTGGAITVDVITSPIGLSHTITYDGLSAGPTNVGSYEVVATITDALIYGSTTGTLEITKGSQTITFPQIAAQKTNATVGISATGGASGNPVTFAVGSGPGTLDTTNLTFTGIGDVLVVASQTGSANYNAAPDVTNTVRVFSVTPDNGPLAGGNTVTITNGHFGTITNAIVGAPSVGSASIEDSGSSYVTLTMPPATNANLTDITLQTVEYGDILLANAYTYNPQGRIEQADYEEYRIEFRSTISSAYPAYTSPDGTYTWTQIARDNDWKELQTTNGTAAGVYLKPFGYSSGTTSGWGPQGYDWIAEGAADTFVYVNSSSLNTNYVVITNLQGSSYRVDVVNAYSSSSYPNSDTLHAGIYQPGIPADNANYGNWPSGGNTNAGKDINVMDVYNSQSNYVTWADATPSNGALSVVLFKSQALGNMLNCMRISGYSGTPPAMPSSGSWTGGYPVVIAGENINDGSDITNVTLCGVQATIVSQDVDHVWVTAGSSTNIGTGDIVVQSTSYGTTVGSNVFTYTGAGILVSSPPFTSIPFGSIVTNMLTVTNAGTEALVIASATNSGAGAAHFDVSALTGLTVDPGTASNVPVVFTASEIGTFNPICHTENNSPVPNYYFGLYGQVYQTSTNTGPWSGGNTIILTNGLIGSGSDITNITIGGYAATVGSQGANWVEITLGTASTNGGAGDIVIQSTSLGESTFANAYTYNPQGYIPPGGVVTQAYVIGSGSLTNVVSPYTSAFSPIYFYYYSSHYQFLYQASDFATAGLSGPARIVALGFDVVSSTQSKALPSFLVRMKHSDVVNMSGGMEGTDLTVCYSNAGYVATAGGFDMLTFDTPFEWDGSSNIIVDTAFAKATNYCLCGQTTYDAIDSRGFAYRIDANDTSYIFNQGSTISVLPRIRILTEENTTPVTPSSGSWTGNYPVVISGSNLGNGDITNVTLCGMQATIVSQTTDRVWIMAGASSSVMSGDIVIQSVSYGNTVAANAFTYTGPQLTILGTNGAVVESSVDFQSANGTLFSSLKPNASLTNTFSITNSGTSTLTLDATDLSAQTAGTPFTISALPATLPAGAISNFTAIFAPTTVGNFSVSLRMTNDGPISPFVLNLGGACYNISTTTGPYGGGNTVTLDSTGIGNGTDITNIIMGGVSTTDITSQTADSVTFVVPDSAASGALDITVQSQSQGQITFVGVYTFDAPTTLYVNAAQPDNSGSGAHWTSAKRTIQSAVDLLGNGGQVWVTNGIYSEGGAKTPGYALTNRVCVTNATTVQSVNGPEVTVIEGAAGSNGSNDLDAIRGVFLGGGATLNGFTVTNGYTATTGNGNFDQAGGGIFMMTNCVASNLVVSGNAAHNDHGGVVLYLGGTLLNSTISGNHSSDRSGGVGLNEGSVVNACVIENNSAGNEVGGAYCWRGGQINNTLIRGNTAAGNMGGVYLYQGGTLNNCTLTGNAAAGNGGGVYLSDGGTLNNCIVYANTATTSGNDIYNSGGTAIRNTCASDGLTHGVDGCITSDPLLNADDTLSPRSPCYNTGDNTYAPTNVASTDLARRERIAWNTVDMGAYEVQSRMSTLTGPLAGGNTITVTNTYAFGNITNVLVGAPTVWSATLEAHGPNWFTITLPPATNAGPVSLTIQTSDHGDSTLQYAYTYNPAGQIDHLQPASGSWTGGYDVVISGTNLCDGSDVTNVTLCGIVASGIASQSPTQIVVVAGASSSGAQTGDVVVYSTSYGVTTQSNAFEYLKETQVITNFTPASGGFLTTNVLGLAAQPSSGLQPSFALVSGPGSLSGSTNLSFTGAGTVYVRASQVGDNKWFAAVPVTNTYTISRAEQAALTFSPITPQNYGSTNGLSLSGGSGTGVVSFAVQSGPGQLIGETNLLATAGTGTITVVATKFGDAYYNTIAATAAVTCIPKAQSIDFTAIANQQTTGTVTLVASASSGLSMDFAVASGPAVLNNLTTLTFTNSGDVVVTASQAGDSDWAPASATNTFTVSKVPVTITISNLTQTYDGSPKSVFISSTPVVSPITLTYNGNADAPTEPGAYAVTAAVANVLYSGLETATLTILDVPRMKLLRGTNEIPTNASASVLFGTDFGAVATNEAVSLLLSITNNGAMPLGISGVGLTGTGSPWLTISNLPSRVEVNSASNFLVNWAPGALGPMTMQVVITNDSVTPQFEVNFAGSGIKPGEIGINAAQLSYQATRGGGNPSEQTYVLTNKGQQAFTWTNVISYSANGSDWLTFRPWSGTQATDVVTVVTGTVDIAGLDAGTYRATNAITASGTLNSPVEMLFELTIAKTAQTIAFDNPGGQVTTSTTPLSATASSGLPVRFEVVSGAALLSDQTNLTYQSHGSVTIVATQTGSVNYAAASTVTQTFDVARAPQYALTFDPTTPQMYASTQTLSVVGGSGTGSVSYAVLSGPGSVNNETNLVAESGTGTIQVRAFKASDAMYESMAATASVTCVKASQTVTFPKPDDTTVTNTTALSATASSGMDVTFRVVAGSASLDNATTLVYSAVGSVTVAADQAGDNRYQPASTTQTFNVAKGHVVVTLTNLTQIYDSAAKVVTAITAPAGMTILITYNGHAWAPTNAGTYAVTGTVNEALYQGQATGLLTILTRTLTVTGAVAQNKTYDRTTAATIQGGGLVGIQGSDAITLGNKTTGTFASAHAGSNISVSTYMTISGAQVTNYTLTQPTLTANISKADQTIAFPSITDLFWTNTLSLAATSTSELAVGFEVVSGPVTITNTTAYFTGIGTASVRAVQSGNANYNAANPVSHSFTALGPQFTLLGTNGMAIPSSADFQLANGTDFGSLIIGLQIQTNTFTLTNNGTANLTISEVTTNGSPSFTLHPSAFIIPPSSGVDIPITFDPQIGG